MQRRTRRRGRTDDRVWSTQNDDRVVAVLADGAGGMPGDADTAELVVTAVRGLCRTRAVPSTPQGLCALLTRLDEDMGGRLRSCGRAAYLLWLKPLLGMVTYEPVDQVNEIADWLIATDAGDELELLAGDIRARATELEIPLGRRDEPALIEMVHEMFWRFEGQRGKHARLGRWIMLLPNSVSIHKPLFANGFHSIMIFDKVPASPPEGFFGRIVSDRVFVVSYHCGRCSRPLKPAGRTHLIRDVDLSQGGDFAPPPACGSLEATRREATRHGAISVSPPAADPSDDCVFETCRRRC